MSLPLTKEQKHEAILSLRRYCTAELDTTLSEMQAGFLLDYFQRELAPFAYNQGVEDARKYLFARTEELPGACFEEPLTYWKAHPSSTREVRRKPGS